MIDISEEKREKVRTILLTPIIGIKWNKKPFMYNRVIYTGQEYYSYIDEDMSDFAIGFYNIIYGDIIEAGGLLDKKQLSNRDFAGDTMNSFVSMGKLANLDAQGIKEVTMDYFHLYHCLANFWILPMDIGRKSKKLNYFDSIDIFLGRLGEEDEYEKIIGKYASYKNKVRNYSEFLNKHYINIDEINKTISYKEDNLVELIEHARDMILSRADMISKSDVASKLYNYFKELGMVED